MLTVSRSDADRGLEACVAKQRERDIKEKGRMSRAGKHVHPA
jgi:hypothetical protein